MSAESASSKFVELFGESLQGSDGPAAPVSAASLAGKTQVGIYFSAHWCPPCRGFTPVLAETYKAVVAAGNDFEVVFVSSDRDEDQFNEYFAEMPWLALPFAQRERKSALSKKFKVQGIPTLVILDGEGNVVSTKGRNMVSNDPTGSTFPWTPPTLQSLLGDEFVQADGTTVGAEAISGKPLGIYFSAHWCGPCRNFTPTLAETYKTLKAEGTDMDIVFISADQDEDSFQSYLSEMPWKALPYSKRKEESQLSEMFGVEGIPSLVMIESLESGRVINANARSAAGSDPKGEQFPWWPNPVNDLNENQDHIGDTPCLVVFMEDEDPATQASISSAILSVAQTYIDAAKATGDDQEFYFFFASQPGGASNHFRNLSDIAGKETNVILLDIPDNGGFYLFDDPQSGITAERLTQFLHDFKGKTLARQQLTRR